MALDTPSPANSVVMLPEGKLDDFEQLENAMK